MPDTGAGLRDVAEGLGLLLGTQSFAVRALMGSLAAAGLAALVVRLGLIRSAQARRVLVLGPIAVAAVAAVASAGEQFLPELLVAGGASADGHVLELLGVEIPQRQLNLLLVVYGVVVSVLASRRLGGLLAARRIRRAAVTPASPDLVALAGRLAARMDVDAPPVRLLERCPGGACTVGVRRPVVVVDPALLARLDALEVEGLIAHELAHIARHDTLMGLLAGCVRDIAFFLPPLHLACRWLRHEQEESADELASRHTRRPGALASTIVKVWEGSRKGPSPQLACATIVPSRLAAVGLAHRLPAGAEQALPGSDPLTGAARAVAQRVMRLLEWTPSVSVWRVRGETVLAAAVLAVATSAALVLPAHLPVKGDLLLGYYVLPPVSQAVESPAFTTFRALAPEPAPLAPTAPAVPSRAGVPGCVNCLMVESQTDLRQGRAAAPPTRVRGWENEGYYPWETREARPGPVPSEAQPLWSMDRSGSRLGFFLVTERAARP